VRDAAGASAGGDEEKEKGNEITFEHSRTFACRYWP
jgi:hypothetical protein